jgi:chromosome partitioning protein
MSYVPIRASLHHALSPQRDRDGSGELLLHGEYVPRVALVGLGQLLRNVQLVQRNLNPVLELSAMVLVMYDARTKLADQVVQEVRDHFGEKVCRSIVPRTVRLSEAPSFGQPIITIDSASRGSIAYRELAKEVSGGAAQRVG